MRCIQPQNPTAFSWHRNCGQSMKTAEWFFRLVASFGEMPRSVPTKPTVRYLCHWPPVIGTLLLFSGLTATLSCRSRSGGRFCLCVMQYSGAATILFSLHHLKGYIRVLVGLKLYKLSFLERFTYNFFRLWFRELFPLIWRKTTEMRQCRPRLKRSCEQFCRKLDSVRLQTDTGNMLSW